MTQAANVYLVQIDEQPIELYKLLKIADLVSGGGEAKVLISEGYVLLNNEVEFQKRKKVYDGDYIQLGDNIIEVEFVEQLVAPEGAQTTDARDVEQPQKTIDLNKQKSNSARSNSSKKPKNSKKTNKNTSSSTKQNKSKTDSKKGKRRRISF